MKYLALILILASTSALARRRNQPYKILIIADAASVASANSYRDYLMNQRPFNRLAPADLVIEVQTAPAEDMACTNPGTTNDRLIRCNTGNLRRMRRQARASIAVAYTSTATGGAGGEIPVATSNFAQYPISTMFHEMLHAYGFADEYQYQTEGERKSFCKPPRRLPNVAYFNDTPPYASDAAARSTHSNQVPWMGDIPAEVLITHGTDLGTTELPASAAVGAQVQGLFAGGPCSLWMKSWRPYQGSIMREYRDDTIYPLYERAILSRIEDAIGRTPTLVEVAPPADSEIIVTNSIPAIEPDCPPENTAITNTVDNFVNHGLRVMEGMDDSKVRSQLKRIQDRYGKVSFSGPETTVQTPIPDLNLAPLKKPVIVPFSREIIIIDQPIQAQPEPIPDPDPVFVP